MIVDAYSFNFQIKRIKGRKTRTNFNKKSELNAFNEHSWRYTSKVIDREEYAKFLTPKPM